MAAGRTSERRSARRRSLVALLAALAAHGFLAVVLRRLAETPPRPQPPYCPVSPSPHPPITIEVREPSRQAPRVVPPKQPERRHRRAAAAQAETKPANNGGETSQVVAGGTPWPTPAPPSPPAPGEGPDKKLSLGELLALPPLPGTPGIDVGGSGSTGSAGQQTSAQERALVQSRIDSAVTEFHAHDRVGVGLVDPYFTQLANSMRGKWRPKVADAGGSDNNGALGQLANLVQSWNAVGKQYAATGSPFPAADTPLPADARPVQRDPAGNSGYDAADFLTRWNAGEFAFSGGLVLVELTQAPEGQPISVKVVQSSGSKKLDESAKRSVLEAARVADAPPKHGLGLGGPNIRSLWEMQARMVSNTCVPATDPTGDTNGNKGAGALPGLMCGGTFDIAMGTFDVNAPGQTRVVTHVVLMAVYGGEAGPYEGKPDQTATQ